MEKGSILESRKENRKWADNPHGSEAISKGFENVSNRQSDQNSLGDIGNGSGDEP